MTGPETEVGSIRSRNRAQSFRPVRLYSRHRGRRAPDEFRWVLLAIAALIPGRVIGQIPGLPTPTPPGVDRTFELLFGNDFLGRGGEFDDHRTQQLGLTAFVAPRWMVVLDHSILTLENPSQGDPGRLDQLSASVGTRVFRSVRPNATQDIEVGLGLRTYGQMAGARMQNGFHRLVGADPSRVPYIDSGRTDGTLWISLPRRGLFARGVAVPLLGRGWSFGYWGRGSSLLTTDGQWDGNLGLTAVADLRWFQAWLGVQADAREGYDRDHVSRETAQYESGFGVIYGFRFGPLILESSQQFDGDAAYGQARFVSTDAALARRLPGWTVGVQSGLSVPDVYASLQARLSRCKADDCISTARGTVLLDYRFGTPQFGDDVLTYVPTWQLSAAYELEAPPMAARPWMTAFGSVGVGWRNEHLETVGESTDGLIARPVTARSEAVGRAGLVADLGLRFSTVATGRSVGLMLQLGLSGWLPTSEAEVEFGGGTEQLQQARIVIVPGLLVRINLGSDP